MVDNETLRLRSLRVTMVHAKDMLMTVRDHAKDCGFPVWHTFLKTEGHLVDLIRQVYELENSNPGLWGDPKFQLKRDLEKEPLSQ